MEPQNGFAVIIALHFYPPPGWDPYTQAYCACNTLCSAACSCWSIARLGCGTPRNACRGWEVRFSGKPACGYDGVDPHRKKRHGAGKMEPVADDPLFVQEVSKVMMFFGVFLPCIDLHQFFVHCFLVWRWQFFGTKILKSHKPPSQILCALCLCFFWCLSSLLRAVFHLWLLLSVCVEMAGAWWDFPC